MAPRQLMSTALRFAAGGSKRYRLSVADIIREERETCRRLGRGRRRRRPSGSSLNFVFTH